MNNKYLALCLALALGSGMVGQAQAVSLFSDNVQAPESVTTAPTLSGSKLQQLPWQPLVPPTSQTIKLDANSPQLSQGDIRGAVATIALPANRGTLEITLSSLVDNKSVYAPNVLVLDEQMRPAAYYPSERFAYAGPEVMDTDRLQGTLRLTPALGQQQIYMLVYTTNKDLQQTTKLTAPAKAYAKGVGNAVPDIPDPIAQHSEQGTLKVVVKSDQQNGNVMIGQLMPTSSSDTAATAVIPAPAAAPAAKAHAAPEKVLTDTEEYFNQSIRTAVKQGDIDKALKLLDEAERLGSTTARETFVGSVKSKK
ncbi:maltose operon protein MalM [Limnobaculum zhutongyuii]|uniref:Maltose operon protein MalM n=1 Tax=Limnobaculum zhutongyuii TaxID=2498113 RepID=A0A411WLE5_9GAMM|nr:maltose operon protein MalM [Limnobaculum zhutongyuii]QBH97059.1 maltose operon protein MalM [Limnobaculum zhutongyuii]TQS88318.1 maltose operon protein MalM [Limnobaculum zhutongyuii]